MALKNKMQQNLVHVLQLLIIQTYKHWEKIMGMKDKDTYILHQYTIKKRRVACFEPINVVEFSLSAFLLELLNPALISGFKKVFLLLQKSWGNPEQTFFFNCQCSKNQDFRNPDQLVNCYSILDYFKNFQEIRIFGQVAIFLRLKINYVCKSHHNNLVVFATS